ncbi:M15 family metallopeptidase [Lysinibacillus sp. NPDC093210]|uniref:M15 family metallopeptidase n=1 Tax=Lysinibacillus sp. NPDC093210 TaxID=3364133 RepID=UPI00381B8259
MMQEKIYQPIEVNYTPKNQQPTPIIQKSFEPLIKIDKQQSRIFTQPVYYLQQIANSLQSIYLRKEAFERLQQALLLLPENYSFILYDGYRPFQVQQFLFSHFSERIQHQHPNFTKEAVFKETLKYVAYPSEGQEHLVPHVTGGAIDLTLGDDKGNALDFGTAFDEISEKSATRYFELHSDENREACVHRRLLYNCMTAVGFTNYAEEWWHYDFHNIAWARRGNAKEARYGAIEAKIENYLIKEYRYL